MRRKFYTKADYQHMPNVGNKHSDADVAIAHRPYRVNIPKQIRLEPWDFDLEIPNLHGIQFDYVDPPDGGARDEGMDYDEEEADAEEMDDVERRGQRRGRDEANVDRDLVVRDGAIRRHRVNPPGTPDGVAVQRRARADPRDDRPRGFAPLDAEAAQQERERGPNRARREVFRNFTVNGRAHNHLAGNRMYNPTGLGGGLPPQPARGNRKRGPPQP